ncbi:MAG: S8 family serine peptidase [Chitinophagales bacterium]
MIQNQIYEFKIDGLDLITSLSCAYNKLQSLSINGIDELSTLRCNNNQIPLELLTFIRFQPSYDPNTYVLTPQNNSEAIYYLEFDIGETLNYSEGNVESFTQYRWNKVDGDTITTFDSKGQLILDFTDTTMAGDYYFESINEDFPGDTVLEPIYRIAVNDTLSDNLSVVTVGELIIDLEDPTPTTDSIINYLIESGAYVIDSCVCGGPKLWEIPDTVYVGLNKYLNFNAVKTWGKTELDAEGGSADFNYEWGDNLPSNDDFPYTYSVPYKNYGSNDDVLLSIIDQGIDMTHPDLLSWVWNPIGSNCGIAYSTVYSGYLFSDSSTIASGLSEPIDDSGHGTGVAGIVPQAANASVNIDIFNERISGVGESATLFKAICAINSAIVEEASVVNMSLGYWGNRSDIFEGIIQDAADANIIIVVSAGNDSMDLQPYVGQDYGFFPANYTRNEFPNLITTGGYDKNMAPVDFSNFCAECVDVAGPSKNMRSSKFNTQTFDWFSGTSFTSPYVSGIIASIYAGLGKNTPYASVIDTFFNDFTKDSTLYTNLVKNERILDVSAKYLCDYQPITVDDEVYDTNVVQITIDPTTNDCIAIPCSSELTIVQNGQMGTADVIGTSNLIDYFVTSADTIIKDTIIYQFCYLSCPQAEVECGTAYIFIDVKNHTPYEITILDSSCNPADTGTVVQNLIATIGVDSIITTITSLLPSDSVNLTAESCDPNEVGTETVVLSNQYGCDSVVTITTTLLKSDSVTITTESCDPNEVGTEIVTLTNQYGCDSVVTIITTLLPTDSVTLTAESCDPNEVGTEILTLTNQYGCDSVITIITSLLSSDSVILTAESCDPNEVGTESVTLTNQAGCDSVVTTITSLLPSYTITIDATSCDPNEVGVETELFTSVYGCDSIVITNTTLSQGDAVTIEAESCDPNEVGTETVTLVNQAGCDSVVTTITSLIPSYTITIDATSCDPNEVGVETELFTSVYGCDSIVITNTTLSQGDAVTIEAESCDPNEVGTETVTLVNQAGCDSIVTINTSLIPSYAITIDATSCDPNDVGTVTNLFTSVYGCDSVVTIITTLLPSDVVTIETESCDPNEVGTETVILFNQYGCDSIVSIVTVLAADCEECVTPDNLYATNITFTQATLGWDEVEGAIRYQAEGRLKNSIFGLTKKRIVQDNVFRTNNLFPFLTYQFRVRTDCSDGWTPWSYWYDFTLNPFLNLNVSPNLSIVSKDIEEIDLFDVDRVFVVNVDAQTKMIHTYYYGEELSGGSIMISDVSGRILNHSDFDLYPNSIKSIQLSKELANGIYFVSLVKDDLVLEVEKIILH